MVKNSKAAYVHGVEVTDSIASWLKGILGGLFFAPPLANFRSNSILAIHQANKVRICINVSLPKDNSLNWNITKHCLEKIEMTFAKLFSYSVIQLASTGILRIFSQGIVS